MNDGLTEKRDNKEYQHKSHGWASAKKAPHFIIPNRPRPSEASGSEKNLPRMCLAEGEEATPSATGEKNNTSWR
jgi:hypothetical protein